MGWTAISSRESSTIVDSWQEYLCIRPASDGKGWELGICGHEVLGEPPSAWFDDEGSPLPEHRDERGDLRLPDEWEGRPVSHYDGEFIMGELSLSTDNSTTQIEALTPETIDNALLTLGWTEEDAAKQIELYCCRNDSSGLSG